MTRKPTNIAASVSQRLLQRSQSLGEDYQLTLQRYAIERLLFRLSQSPVHDRFVLKVAMLYLVWGGEIYRPTRDLDLLGYGPDTAEAVNDCFRSLCSIEVKDDGLAFLPGTVRSEKIRDAAEYGGLRVRLEVRLDRHASMFRWISALVMSSFPAPRKRRFPPFSKGLAPRIRAYSRESVVAEKLHAAALLGDANSRLKDFYDLFALSALFSFEGPTLTRAIAATFARRRTSLPEVLPLPEAFFANEVRAGRWRAYLAKNGLRNAPRDFAATGEAIREFLARPYEALVEGGELPVSWPPGGPWR